MTDTTDKGAKSLTDEELLAIVDAATPRWGHDAKRALSTEAQS